jgi:L-threonylcarbamoyladenylate synthase
MTQVSLTDLVMGASSGQLVSFPTDTVPALAVRPQQSELIFAAKRRSQEKPLILMGAVSDSLWPFVKGSQEEQQIWQQVADCYWPGALTLVLPASDQVPSEMNPSNPTTIGLRVPNHAIAQTILSQTGPLATTSANLSGHPPLLTSAEIAAEFPEALTLLAEEWQSPATAIPSTVAQWTGEGWKILRQGAVQLESLFMIA